MTATRTSMLTVLVCGGRAYDDRRRVNRLLDFNKAKIARIVHGGARGADTIAGQWAELNGVPCDRYPADWSRWGKAAGTKRNEWMLENARPDLVVAFPGGAGTAHMVWIARAAGVRVIEVPA